MLQNIKKPSSGELYAMLLTIPMSMLGEKKKAAMHQPFLRESD
jgi:hypothetical protein